MNYHIPLRDRLIVALDMPNAFSAKTFIRTLDDSVNFYKIGLELFTDPHVWEVVALLQRLDKKVFIDLKYLDIPETVYRATKRLAEAGVNFMTVHATPQNINAAVRATTGTPTSVLAVTVLTSVDHYRFEEMGADECSIEKLVICRAIHAMKEGADGVVCSGLEAKLLREQFNEGVGSIVCPGIRPIGYPIDDQSRTVTVEEAFTNGADYIVVGRPIRDAANPFLEAESIQSQIKQTISELQ